MDVYNGTEEIVNVILKIYPMGKIFKGKIMEKVKKVPEKELKKILTEVKEIVDKTVWAYLRLNLAW